LNSGGTDLIFGCDKTTVLSFEYKFVATTITATANIVLNIILHALDVNIKFDKGVGGF
jgi:hypothetical protein